VLDLPVAAGSKRRLTDDTVIIDRIIGDVGNREVIVLDDETATAGSIVELLKRLRAEGAGQISLACTHGLFTGPAIERLKQELDIAQIVTTNTVPLPPEHRLPSMATRQSLRCLRKPCTGSMWGESISSLFRDEPTHG
jgi:ribose-phosphate pyrophosphokinase